MAAEEDFYEKAFDEVRGTGLKKAIWARALAEHDGDENKAKAAYIRRRVIELTAHNELKSNGLRQSVWAKAFAEHDGNEVKAQHAYVHQRIAELTAEDELSKTELKAGTWAKALAENDGDERRAKAQYVKMRVSEVFASESAAKRAQEKASSQSRKMATTTTRPPSSAGKKETYAYSHSSSDKFAGFSDSAAIIGATFSVSFFVTWICSNGFLLLNIEWIPIFVWSAAPFFVPVYYFSKQESMLGLQYTNLNVKITSGLLIAILWMFGILGCAVSNSSMTAFNASYVPSVAIIGWSMAAWPRGEKAKTDNYQEVGTSLEDNNRGALAVFVDECQYVILLAGLGLVAMAISFLLG